MSLCESHGQCAFVAPDVFSLDEDAELSYDAAPGEARRVEVLQAAAACPAQAIRVRG